jgi:hypothetical protein
MQIRGFDVDSFSTLPSDTIQSFLDGLAALSTRHGIVVDMANLMPLHPGAGGYFVSPGGYLTTASPDEAGEMMRAPQGSAAPEARAYVTAFAAISGHDRLRILRDIG